jgi:hypothetical protein
MRSWPIKPPPARPINRAHPQACGLVGLYALNESGGAVARDLSGFRNDGALTNGPSWVAGLRGASLNFDGSDDYINVPASASLSAFPNGITISAWIKPRSVPGGFPAIVEKTDDYTSNRVHFMISSDQNDRLHWGFGSAFNTPTGASHGITLGEWQHVAVSYDLANVRVFRNGALKETTATTVAVPNTANPLRIGTRSPSPGPGNYFDGAIDDVRVYNRALTAAEIVRLYVDPLGVFMPPIIPGRRPGSSRLVYPGGALPGPSLVRAA